MGDIIKGHPNIEIINALEHNKLCRLSYSNNRILHIANKYPKHVIVQMNLLRERKELCDVVIKVGPRCLHAHRAILSAASPYFYAMFTGKLSESRDTEITIHEISDLAIEQLIDFIYTATIVIEEVNVQSLLPAACLLQMVDIQEACCEFLKNQLDPTNCLGIRAFADTHSCRELLKIANQFTQNNFLEVIINEEFLLLPYEQLIEILSSDELNVRNEEQVFKAVMAWVKFNLPERKSLLYNVLEYVRLPLINPKFLVGTVGSDPLIKQDERCRDLVDEAKNYLLLPQERPQMQGPRTKPRKVMRRGEVLFVAGGWCNGDAISSVERYDPETNEWRMAAPMIKRRCGVGVAVLNDLLYAVGGHDGQSYLNTIERYDPRMNVWSCDVAPTSTCRTSVGVAAHDNYLYAVGGQDGVSCLNLVERYNPTTNRWFKIASMKTRRLGVAVAVLGPYLYAVGGADGTMPLNTVERYDPSTNKWTYVAPMGTRRKHLGVTVYNNHLYAVGGRDNTTELSSAERYSPQTNKWTPIVAMTSRRSGVGLAVVNGLLVAVGGFDGTAYLKTIEVYDPTLGSWKLCGSMNYRRLGGGVGVLKVPGSAITEHTPDLSPDIPLARNDVTCDVDHYVTNETTARALDCDAHCVKMVSCCSRCHRADVFWNPEILNDVEMSPVASCESNLPISLALPDTCAIDTPTIRAECHLSTNNYSASQNSEVCNQGPTFLQFPIVLPTAGTVVDDSMPPTASTHMCSLTQIEHLPQSCSHEGNARDGPAENHLPEEETNDFEE